MSKERETVSNDSNCYYRMKYHKTEPKTDSLQEHRNRDIREEPVKDAGEKER